MLGSFCGLGQQVALQGAGTCCLHPAGDVLKLGYPKPASEKSRLLLMHSASYHLSEILSFSMYPSCGNLNQVPYQKRSLVGRCPALPGGERVKSGVCPPEGGGVYWFWPQRPHNHKEPSMVEWYVII